MNHIEINYEAVESVIAELTSMLNSNQSNIDASYSRLAGDFSESSGEEATALRGIQEAERSLMEEMNAVLTKFGESIRFAADEFRNLDTTGAGIMGGIGAKK